MTPYRASFSATGIRLLLCSCHVHAYWLATGITHPSLGTYTATHDFYTSATSTAPVEVLGRDGSSIDAKAMYPPVPISPTTLEARSLTESEETASRLANTTEIKSLVQNATDTLISYMTELNMLKLLTESKLQRSVEPSSSQSTNLSWFGNGQLAPGIESILEVEKTFQEGMHLADLFIYNLNIIIMGLEDELENGQAPGSSQTTNPLSSTQASSGGYGSISTSRNPSSVPSGSVALTFTSRPSGLPQFPAPPTLSNMFGTNSMAITKSGSATLPASITRSLSGMSCELHSSSSFSTSGLVVRPTSVSEDSSSSSTTTGSAVDTGQTATITVVSASPTTTTVTVTADKDGEHTSTTSKTTTAKITVTVDPGNPNARETGTSKTDDQPELRGVETLITARDVSDDGCVAFEVAETFTTEMSSSTATTTMYSRKPQDYTLGFLTSAPASANALPVVVSTAQRSLGRPNCLFRMIHYVLSYMLSIKRSVLFF